MSKENLEKEIAKGNVSTIAFYNPDGSNMLYTQKYVEQKDKEIERLNNIIDELEKMFDGDLDGFQTINEKGACNDILEVIEIYKNKLKELKEGKK